MVRFPRIRALLPFALSWVPAGCAPDGPDRTPKTEPLAESASIAPVTLRFSAFTTAREAYEKRIIPLFVEQWRRSKGQVIRFDQSYGASGAQVQAILDGFEADIAVLSNEEDVERLVHSRLVRSDWQWGESHGIVSRSVVVLAVRQGNPRGVRDWSDLPRPGLRLVLPDPSSSGGGRWGITAMYGAALRGAGHERTVNLAVAESFLARVLPRVVRWSPTARESFEAFEQGLGDVAITSESEVMRSRMFGHEVDWVVPRSTLRMDNPAVVVDVYAERHGLASIARAFLDFLVSEEAQRAFALRGFRRVVPLPAAGGADPAKPEVDLWGIEDLGGWPRVREDLFGPGAAFDRARATARDD
ncbi:MAG: sulfate ABC transporter substrate-binding protein [Planctomycetota bacterium]